MLEPRGGWAKAQDGVASGDGAQCRGGGRGGGLADLWELMPRAHQPAWVLFVGNKPGTGGRTDGQEEKGGQGLRLW